MKTYKTRVPHNLNIEEIVKHHPPAFSYHPDEFNYLIGKVVELPSWNKDLFEKREFPFTPLYSQLLKPVIWNYQYHLKYLLEVGVLETDGFYSNIGFSKSKGYRLSPSYRTRVIETLITSSKLVTRITQLSVQRNIEASKRYSHLIHWFDGLEFDLERANQLREDLYKENTFKATRSAMEKANLKDAAYHYMVQAMAEKRYQFVIDSAGYRLHTNLTNLKRDFRSCLTYQGSPLVAVDLCNSQPYLASVLFNQRFYQPMNDSERLTINQLSLRSNRLINPLIEKISQKLINENSNKCKLITNYSLQYSNSHNWGGAYLLPMCGKLDDSNEQLDEVALYNSLVSSGHYYEYMQSHIKRANGDYTLSRDEVKETTLTIFFSDPDDDRHYFKMQREAFCQVFPGVYELFSLLKSNRYNTLAILLQNIESVLFLNQIAGRITQERPELPIYTLHDSIICTAGSEEYVQSVMYDELFRATGLIPKFKLETWQP